MSQLFSPVRIGKLELENRIVIAPMCQYSADNGKATAWHRIHLGQLAFSGAGLLIIEASAVEPAGRITHRYPAGPCRTKSLFRSPLAGGTPAGA